MEEHNCKIYCHTFPNGKKYIGLTSKKLSTRFGRNGNNYAWQPVIYRAIKKYGWENVIHEILEDNLTIDKANERERYYIKLYNTTDIHYGYNVEPGGGSVAGLSEATKKKISKTLTGRKHTAEHNAHIAMSNRGIRHGYCWNKGLHLNNIIKDKIRAARLGQHITSKETIEKLRNASMGEKNSNAKPVKVIDTVENKEYVFKCRVQSKELLGIEFKHFPEYIRKGKLYKNRFLFKEVEDGNN